jgi:predicted lipid-binding transport protein (Tim44 family)
MMRVRRFRPLMVLFAMLAALLIVATEADARAGGGFSSGSRGTRSFSTPPSTTTAPNSASPLQRTMAQPGQTGVRSPGLFGGFFNRPGLFGGLLGGFLGAGLLGLLFGHGLFGGLGGIASIFGLLLQIALVFLVARLIWAWWQRRSMPAYASGPMLREVSSGHGGGPGYGSGAPAAGATIAIGQADFDAFERLLSEIQTAYGAEDLAGLRQRATPEMVSYFADDLAKNASRGVINRVSDVKLLNGDLAEAWREDGGEYASFAMRYALKDYYVDRAGGHVVEGDAEHPAEATELWTFRRNPGGAWLLSAIQQT